MLKFLLILLLGCLSCAHSGPDVEAVDLAIREIMQAQAASWNEGKLDGYMRHYWRSGNLTFHGGKQSYRGWETLKGMYGESYPEGKQGELTFSELEIKVLSDEYAFVLGQWTVEMPDTVKEGRFTVIFRKLDQGWRIIHDHSS